MNLRELLPENIRRLKKEAMDAPPAHITPPAIHQQISQPSKGNNFYHASEKFQVTPDFIKFIKSIENPRAVGYNKLKKLWFPHPSPEGGLPTIAFGHKTTNADVKRLSAGITDAEANKLLLDDLEVASRAAKSYVTSRFGNTPLSNEQWEMLTEFSFNLGGLRKFPKFTEAVVKQDWNTAKKEYKRSYTNKGGTREPLATRNTAFFNRYLRNK